MAHPCAHASGGIGAELNDPSGQRSQSDGSAGHFAFGGKWTDVPEYNYAIEQQFAGFVRSLPNPGPQRAELGIKAPSAATCMARAPC